MKPELLKKIAKRRMNLHKGQKSQRKLSDNYEYIGLTGEVAFAEEFGYKVDFSKKIGGDAGVDFRTNIGTIDVKTARKAYFLIVEIGKVHADIYFLAAYDEKTETAKLIGWEYGEKIKKAPTRDFGYGIITHYIPANELRSIEEAKRLIKRE